MTNPASRISPPETPKPRTQVDYHVDLARNYLQKALDGNEEQMTKEQWIAGAQVHAALAQARATEQSR